MLKGHIVLLKRLRDERRLGETHARVGLKGIGFIRAQRAPLGRRVLAGLERGAKFRAPGSRGLEGCGWVSTEPQHRLLSAHLVPQAPEPRVRGRDEEEQATAISELIRARLGFGAANSCVGQKVCECHRRTHRPSAYPPSYPPPLAYPPFLADTAWSASRVSK